MGADQRGEQQGTRVVRVGLREGQSGMAALLLCQEEAEEQELDPLLMLGKDYCYHSERSLSAGFDIVFLILAYALLK